MASWIEWDLYDPGRGSVNPAAIFLPDEEIAPVSVLNGGSKSVIATPLKSGGSNLRNDNPRFT
jgi:hypothetical protein